jgi:hypothetical protein
MTKAILPVARPKNEFAVASNLRAATVTRSKPIPLARFITSITGNRTAILRRCTALAVK